MITVRHEHDDHFHVEIRHHGFVVDQPRDHGGTDLGPTPTELFVASIASCSAVYARRFCSRHGIAPTGLSVDCDFTMSDEPPLRVARITMNVTLPTGFPADLREQLLRVVDRCTVKSSIRIAPEIGVELSVIGAASAS